MVHKFEEIEAFFSQDKFTDVDLNLLYKQIEEVYNNNATRNAAMSSINLKLLSFKLKTVNSKNEITTTSKTKTVKKLSSKKNIEEHFLDITMGKPITKIIAILGISDKNLASVLDLKLEDINHKNKFTLEFWDKGKDFFIDKLNQIKNVKSHDKQMVKRTSVKLNEFTNVYDKAKLYGGLGKVIYIRQK